MIWMIAIFIILIFIICESFLPKNIRFLFKMVASFSYFFLAIYYFENLSQILIILGLGFGVLGDLALGLRYILPYKKECLISGIISFFIGHLFYYIALTKTKNSFFLESFILTITIMMLVIGIQKKSTKLNPTIKFFVYLYMTFLTFLACTSIINLIYYYVFNNFVINYFLSIGIIIFSISDLFLNALYFKSLPLIKRKYYRYLNLIFYYGAQLLIVYSIFFY